MAQPAVKQRTREAYWDAVRAIAIIVVIWVHARTGIPYRDSPDAWNFDYWVAARGFINFPVAVFIFLAGYFVDPARLSPAVPWLRRRAVRLLIPFFVWSLIYGLIELWQAGGAVDPLAVVFRVGIGYTAAHLYFIVVLIQLTLLTPWLVRAMATRWGWMLFLITPVYLVGMYAVAFAIGGQPPGYNYPFAGWLAFYLFGLWVRARGVRFTSLPKASALVVLSGLLSVIEGFALLGVGQTTSFAVNQLQFSSVLCSFAVIILVLTVHGRWRSAPGWLATIGRDSYGIYYVHMVWIMALAAVIRSVPALADFPFLPALQAVEVVIALALSLATIVLVRRLLGRPAASRVLGF